MVLATGTSNQHIRTLANKLQEAAKKQDHHIIGVEGETSAEWVLIDFGNAVVHLMLQAVRDYYQLEKLWS
jgi:ribosome-associated protein